MKKATILILSTVFSFGLSAQMQIENSGFEDWESVSGGSEPVNWSSFLTAGGPSLITQLAANQVEQSSDVRPGSTGTSSVRINSRSAVGIIANGNITLGRINMGSTSPTSSSNYNSTITADDAFNQEMTDKPDSIVFWVKFTPNGHNQNARMKATIHDEYDYRDPEDSESQNHIVATAELNYPSTNGEWERKSVPFDYSGPSTDPRYILVTFTTNETAGGGKKNDYVWIDDVELIYNTDDGNGDGNGNGDGDVGLATYTLSQSKVYPNPMSDYLMIENVDSTTEFTIVSVLGKTVYKGKLDQGSNKVDTSELNKGVYILHLYQDGDVRSLRVVKN